MAIDNEHLCGVKKAVEVGVESRAVSAACWNLLLKADAPLCVCVFVFPPLSSSLSPLAVLQAFSTFRSVVRRLAWNLPFSLSIVALVAFIALLCVFV